MELSGSRGTTIGSVPAAGTDHAVTRFNISKEEMFFLQEEPHVVAKDRTKSS